MIGPLLNLHMAKTLPSDMPELIFAKSVFHLFLPQTQLGEWSLGQLSSILKCRWAPLPPTLFPAWSNSFALIMAESFFLPLCFFSRSLKSPVSIPLPNRWPLALY